MAVAAAVEAGTWGDSTGRSTAAPCGAAPPAARVGRLPGPGNPAVGLGAAGSDVSGNRMAAYVSCVHVENESRVCHINKINIIRKSRSGRRWP
jgi:hypothetical protein